MFQKATLAALSALPLIAQPTIAQSCLECPTGSVWYVDAGSDPGSATGLDWDHAFPTLTEAIDAASAGDCIWVGAGRYFPSSTNDRSDTFFINKSLKIYGGFDGSETCFADRAGNFSGTRLSGDIGTVGHAPDNSYRVITIQGPPAIGQSLNVVIDGFTIRDAYNNNSSASSGGGIFCEFATKLTVRNCFIRKNAGFGGGGGMFVNGNHFDVVFTQFIDNESDFRGAAIWAALPGNDCNVYNSIFKNNIADGKGGAFYFENFDDDAWARFMNVLFYGNAGASGGVGYLTESVPGSLPGTLPKAQARAELVNCTFSTNTANDGGVFFAEESATNDPGKLDLRNCIAWGNDFVSQNGSILSFTDGLGGTFGDSAVAYTIVELDDTYWDCDLDEDCELVLLPCTSFSCDPLFVGTTFQLGTGSPAIDTGLHLPVGNVLLPDVFDFDDDDGNTTEDVPWDLDGDTRVQGAEIDRGCYETP